MALVNGTETTHKVKDQQNHPLLRALCSSIHSSQAPESRGGPSRLLCDLRTWHSLTAANRRGDGLFAPPSLLKVGASLQLNGDRHSSVSSKRYGPGEGLKCRILLLCSDDSK